MTEADPTPFGLGRRDFENGERGGYGTSGDQAERARGWHAAYRESLEKAARGLKRIHAGRYESEDGQWTILRTGRRRWSLLSGLAYGFRTQTEILGFTTFAEAMEGLREQLGQFDRTA